MIDTSILSYISPDDYDTWFKVGAALKHEGNPVEDWVAWSRASSKYHDGECERKWDTFNEGNSGAPVTGGTIIQMAKENGYVYEGNDVLSWDDLIEEPSKDYHIIDPGFVREESIPKPHNDGADDLIEYLSELFEPDEFVGYCDKLVKIKDRWVPKNGIYTRKAGDIIEDLRKGFDNAAINPNSEGGALIRFNPLDGQGESDRNVTSFRYALLESDSDSIEKQYSLLQAMNLPIKVLVASGNKSLHAIVKVDAETFHQYQERVNFLYDFCKKQGYTPDEQDKNASRYSRMPGILRNGKPQYIISTNIGAPSWAKWRKWVEVQNDNLPPDENLAEVWDNMPPLKEELIPGILRVGHKMLVAGPSKAGKSFLLMELAVCLAEGADWLGHKCRQGKVLYINLELDAASFYHRLKDIYSEMGLAPEHTGDLQVWNLRGRSVPMNKLAPLIVNRFKDKHFEAIIIDPIYKVITGDENSATEMSQFCSYFDVVARENECAMIYCHHHSKGAAGKYANAADRASGSGVFARDPDAILDMTELSLKNVIGKYEEQVPDHSESVSAWELSSTLREFAPMEPQRIWFDYPVHKLDEWNFLASAKYKGSSSQGVGMGQTSAADWPDLIEDAFNNSAFENGACSMEDFLNFLGEPETKVKHYLGKDSKFERITTESGDKLLIRRGTKAFSWNGHGYDRDYVNSKKRWLEIS